MLASDNSRATTTDLVSGRTTETANLTTFGFSIPSTATIDGIIVAIERSASAGGTVTDLAVKLIKGGTISGDNKADTVTTWPTTDGTVTYGGASDLWGLTLLYSDVNASNFGVSISATGVGSAGFPQVDHVTITVYYTDAGGGGQPTRTMHQFRMRRV